MKKVLLSKATTRKHGNISSLSPSLSSSRSQSRRDFTLEKPRKTAEDKSIRKAIEDINSKFTKRKELKRLNSTLAAKQKSQEEKIRDMEDEKKRNYKVISILKEEKKESKRKYESRVQKMEEEIKGKDKERKEEKKKWEAERAELMKERHALSQRYYQVSHEKLSLLQKLNSAEQKNGVMSNMMKTTEMKIVRIEQRCKEVEEERRKEARKWEEERLQLTRDNEDLSKKFLHAVLKSDTLKTKVRTKDDGAPRKDAARTIRDAQDDRKGHRKKWEEERSQLTKEKQDLSQRFHELIKDKQALSQQLQSAEQKYRDISRNTRATEERVRKMEEWIKTLEQERIENSKLWEEEKVQLIREKEDALKRFLSAEENTENMKTKMKSTAQKREEWIKNMRGQKSEERSKLEAERMQLSVEKEALAQKLASSELKLSSSEQKLSSSEQMHESLRAELAATARGMEERMQRVEEERREERSRWEEERVQLVREKEDLSLGLLSAQQTGSASLSLLEEAIREERCRWEEERRKAEEERRRAEEERRRAEEERRSWEEERARLARENEELLRKFFAAEQSGINFREERRRWEEERHHLTRENEELSRKYLSAEQNSVGLLEERREERRRWEDERLQLVTANQEMSRKFLSAEQSSVSMKDEVRIMETKVHRMESVEKDIEEVRVEKMQWEVERHQLSKEKQALARKVLSSQQKTENLTAELKATVLELENRIKTMEEERVDERKRFTEDKRKWDGERSQLTRDKQSLVQLLSPVQQGEFDRMEVSVSELTLDPNSAHKNLSLSDNNRKVTRVRETQDYPEHQDRFDSWEQVVCREGLTGRYYWDVEWSGRVSIAVSYRGIHRKGLCGDCGLGFNDRSWSLECYEVNHLKRYSIRHNRKITKVPFYPSISDRIGVYLDWEAGTLAFYRVLPDSRTHLFTIQTTFTEPLYPGFMFGSDSSVTLFQIEELH